MEALLRDELSALGALDCRETVAGAYFTGPLAVGYRACLWSRLANRILLPIAKVEVTDSDSLYRELRALKWSNWFGPEQTFSIDFSGQNEHIRNTHFGALRGKDAVVDWFVDDCSRRPSVDKKDPDVRLNLRLSKGWLRVSLDFSGGSLHRRGYRKKAGEAPLKENLAAAILLRAGWPAMAAQGGALIDPMCGSATLLVEAALMAADIAPSLQRKRFGFHGWKDHNELQWQAIVADARGRAAKGLESRLPEIRGYDADPRVIRTAQENIATVGLEKHVRVAVKPLAELVKPTHMPMEHGLLVCNPPYGERLGEKAALRFLYRELGEVMLREFSGWQAAIFTSDAELGRATGLRSHKRYALWNGALAASLLLFDLGNNELRRGGVPVQQDNRDAPGQPDTAGGSSSAAGAPSNTAGVSSNTAGGSSSAAGAAGTQAELSEGATMFANRIRKNRRKLASWVKREHIDCYRLYDADMPEYAVAVDLYGTQVHVAEYRAPDSIDPQAAQARLEEVYAALPQALGVDRANIVFKQRQRQRGLQQYQKQGSEGELLSVREGEARLLVNLRDYLDTGLFLDHRRLRLRLGQEASGKHFLNLFCYTGSATVHAALGGARSTTSVDLSNTYLGWLRKNLAHNGLAETSNRAERGNCLQWLQQAQRRYDLILLDPPSFSNSSAMDSSFDVQRDHAELVRAATAVMSADGQLYFSNNRRGFKLDAELQRDYDCKDITPATLDPDFQRARRMHQCWSIRHKN